ncbi:MAG: hypothetical protein AAF587_06545 [Bacteroidota bacterium]
MNHLPKLLLILATLAWGGCNQGNIDMDNSSDQDLIVNIDELSYNMKAGQYTRIQLDKGVHKLVLQDEEGKVLEEESFRVYEGGLLNLGKNNYLIWVDLYGDPELRKSKLEEDWLDIEGDSYFGQFERLDPSKIYVERKWDYGLDDAFPDDLLGWQMTQERWIIKRKLFRESEFIEAYKSLVKE